VKREEKEAAVGRMMSVKIIHGKDMDDDVE